MPPPKSRRAVHGFLGTEVVHERSVFATASPEIQAKIRRAMAEARREAMAFERSLARAIA